MPLNRSQISDRMQALIAHTRGRRRLVLTATTATLVIAAPLALGAPIQGGQRNPGTDPSVSYSAETQIIADNSEWGTRQSNKGTGGGAIYGCRAPVGGSPCIEANNLNKGLAFNFITSGKTGGKITVSNTSGAPFTTNATGVASGLNANFLQGKTASNFLGVTQQAADSAKLGGVAANAYAQGQLLFADVDQTGKLTNNRGATAAAALSSGTTGPTGPTGPTTGPTSFTVTFSGNVSKCSYTASPLGAAVAGGSIGVGPDQTNPNVVDVNLPTAGTSGFSLQVIC